MADKTLGITVTGDIDDISSKLDELTSKIGSVEDKSISLDVNVNDEGLTGLTAEANEAAEEVSQIGDAAEVASADVTSGMDQAQSSLSQTGKSASDAKHETEAMGTKAEETGNKFDVGMNTATMAVAGLTAGLEVSAQHLEDMNYTLDKLGSGYDLGEGAYKDMVADITNVKFPAEEATTYLKTLHKIGTTDANLAKNATDMNKIAIATGTSASEMEKLSLSMRILGVDVNDIGTSFNAMAYANSNLVGGLPTFIQWLQKYDATFAELGLNMDQAAVLVVAAQKKFGGGRAAYSGLNAAIKESNGNLTVLEQKLGLAAGSLSNASQLTGEYSGKIEQNSDKAKEHTTILQNIGAALEDLNIKYGDGIAAIESFGAAFGAVFLGIPTALKLWDSLWGTTYSKSYTTWLNNALSRFKGFGSNISNTIKSWAGWGNEASKAGEDVASGISRASPKAEQSGVKLGESTVKGISKGFNRPQLLDEAGKVLWTDTDDIIRSVGTRATPLAGEIGESIPKSLVSGITKASTRAVGDIALVATTVIDSLANYTESLKDPLKFAFGDLANVIPEDIRGIFSGYNMMKILVGENAADEYMHWAKVTLEDPMKRAIDQTWQDVTSWFGGLTNNTSQKINQSAEMTGNVIKNVADASKLATELVANKMSEAHQQAAQQAAAAWEEAYSKVSQMADNAASRMGEMNSALGISLPGKKYSTYELLQQRSNTIDALRKKRQMIQAGGPSKFNSQSEYLAALSDVDKTIAQYESPQYLNSILNSGKSVGKTFGQGLASGVSSSTNDINKAVGFATGGLQAHSPPKEGPLQEIDKWGESIGQTFVDSMKDGLSSISNILNVTQPTPLPSSTALGVGNGGIHISFGDIQVTDGSNAKQVGLDLATGINEGLASRLVGQANNSGVSTINSMR